MISQRHVIIMLDIDDTLTDHNACENPTVVTETTKATSGKVVYTASRDVWHKQLLELKKIAEDTHGIIIHYGIATSKSHADFVSEHIIYNEKGLSDLIDKKLIYFVGKKCKQLAASYLDIGNARNEAGLIAGYCKAEYALQVAKEHIENTHKTIIPSSDIFIIDDKTEVCLQIAGMGYNTICLAEKVFVTATAHEQMQVVSHMFNIIIPDVLFKGITKSPDENRKQWLKEISDMLMLLDCPPPNHTMQMNRTPVPIPTKHTSTALQCCMFGTPKKPSPTNTIQMVTTTGFSHHAQT